MTPGESAFLAGQLITTRPPAARPSRHQRTSSPASSQRVQLERRLVITSVAALVIMLAYGGSVLAPNDKRLHAMIEDTPEGSVPD